MSEPDRVLAVSTSDNNVALSDYTDSSVAIVSLNPKVINLIDESDNIIFEIRNIQGNIEGSKTLNIQEILHNKENLSNIDNNIKVTELNLQMENQINVILDLVIKKDNCILTVDGDFNNCNSQ